MTRKKSITLCRSCGREKRPGYVTSADMRYSWATTAVPYIAAGSEVCCICINDGVLVAVAS